MIRKATEADIENISGIYNLIHREEAEGKVNIGWNPQTYPTRQTALEALRRNDLFIMEKDGETVASAIINHIPLEAYSKGEWKYEATPDKVMVIHTLVVKPSCQHQGLAKRFLDFYETYAKAAGCTALRLDTQEKNSRAVELYPKLGYTLASVVDSHFGPLGPVRLVLYEKSLTRQP